MFIESIFHAKRFWTFISISSIWNTTPNALSKYESRLCRNLRPDIPEAKCAEQANVDVKECPLNKQLCEREKKSRKVARFPFI